MEPDLQADYSASARVPAGAAAALVCQLIGIVGLAMASILLELQLNYLHSAAFHDWIQKDLMAGTVASFILQMATACLGQSTDYAGLAFSPGTIAHATS